MFRRSGEDEKKCREVCADEEYLMLKLAFLIKSKIVKN